MTARVLALGWLVALWVALWGRLTLGTVLGGLAVALLVTLGLPRASPAPAGTVRPLRLARFIAVFAWKVVEANAVVAWEVVTPGNRINQAIVAVPITATSDLIITSLANTISLTPGTLTVEVRQDPPTLYVHVLHLRSIERTRTDVRRLEWLITRALGPRDVLAPDAPPTPSPPPEE